MKVHKKLLFGFITLTVLPLLINFFVGVTIQRETVRNFQEIAGEMFPGSVALSRMMTELYHTRALVQSYDASRSAHDRDALENSVAALDAYNIMQLVYQKKQDEEQEYADDAVRKITRLVAQFILLINKNADEEELSKIKLKIDETLTKFVTSMESHIEEDVVKSFKKIEETRQKNINARNLLISVGIVIVGIALLLCFFVSRRFRDMYLEIEDYSENLEYMISKRTAQLKEANAVLENEINDRQIAETRYRTVADFTYDWETWELPDSSLAYVSPSSERISGYTAQEFIETPSLFDEIIIPEDQHIWSQHRHEAIDDQKLREIEFRIRRRDGEVRWLEHACLPVTDDEGNFAGFRTSNRDVTERKEAEASLSREKTLAQKYLDVASVMIVALDEEQKVSLINTRGCELLGYSEEEIIGKNWFQHFIPEGQREEVQQVADHLYAGNLEPVEYNENPVLCKNGEERLIAWHNSFVQQGGKVVELLSSGTDVTEQRRAEEEKMQLAEKLRQAQKMESIGTLAGGIAHDFNNILNVINGYSELLLMETPESNKTFSDILEINEAGKRAAELVKQILTFSRQTDQERKPLRIQPVIKEVLKLLRSSLPTTIKIEQDIQDCGTVLADYTQIHQVLINLCTNAFHAMDHQGGVLDISLKEVDIGKEKSLSMHGFPAGRYVHLTVSDTGRGMDKITLGRIFEPYFTTKKTGEGTGLGLAIVYGIIESHGGTISVKSEPGQGTTFTVLLPLVEKTSLSEKEKGEHIELPQINARILFVDDVQYNVELGMRICEQLGCEVTGITDSQEALALFRQDPERFDLIITDQTMPDLTGIQLANAIFETCPEMPIIMVTGHSDMIDEEKAQELGLKDFVMKPFRMEELAESIRSVLEKSKS